jgi:hypothetical protein
LQKELANAIDDFQVSVRSELRMLVLTVSNIMEHYGTDAVSEIEIPQGVLAKSELFSERELKTFNDWGEISRQAEFLLIKRNEDQEERMRDDRSKKNK